MHQTTSVPDPSMPPQSPESERPQCFGDPKEVCPKDEEGIIQPQKTCLSCNFLKKCLQKALVKEGIITDPEARNRIVARTTGFLKRWSDRKLNQANPSSRPDPGVT